MTVEFIKCHGSGNGFVMVDSVAQPTLAECDLAALSRAACDRVRGIGADGLLVLVRNAEGVYGMRMLNPDGSEAEMCGNGIRCIARLAAERYLHCDDFVLTSGGGLYPTRHTEDIFPSVPTFGSTIGVRLWSDDFRMHLSESGDHIDRPIPELHPSLRWTAICVGNPHIVARTEHIDLRLLDELGKRVTTLKEIFPNGVNVSLVEVRERNRIFVATYERGAGITPSCGTAMTSSATAMALLGECDYDTVIDTLNRGGAVRCICSRHNGLHTTLIGNATYEFVGQMTMENGEFHFSVEREEEYEREVYAQFTKSLNNR
jgi:diaminopimelate epimerase